jgi:hypothetical protein
LPDTVAAVTQSGRTGTRGKTAVDFVAPGPIPDLRQLPCDRSIEAVYRAQAAARSGTARWHVAGTTVRRAGRVLARHAVPSRAAAEQLCAPAALMTSVPEPPHPREVAVLAEDQVIYTALGQGQRWWAEGDTAASGASVAVPDDVVDTAASEALHAAAALVAYGRKRDRVAFPDRILDLNRLLAEDRLPPTADLGGLPPTAPPPAARRALTSTTLTAAPPRAPVVVDVVGACATS